jgi:hypothetical protein
LDDNFMTADKYRNLALSLPEATEGQHMGHPDFRVRNKIFASLWPDQGWGMVKLTLDQQSAFVSSSPEIFQPVPGGWGRRGATQVCLAKAKIRAVRQAIVTAWRNSAPKLLVKQFDERIKSD